MLPPTEQGGERQHAVANDPGVQVLLAAFLAFNQVGEGSNPSGPINAEATAQRSADALLAVLGCFHSGPTDRRRAAARSSMVRVGSL